MSDIELRRATPEDAEAIARVHVASCRAAYAGLVAQRYLDALDVAKRADEWRRTMDEPETVVVVAERDSVVVGFVCAGPNHSDPKQGPGEVQALWVLEDEQRQGTGSALLNAGAGNLRKLQRVPFVLRVLAASDGACRFCERRGGYLLDERTIQIDGVKYEERIYQFDG